MAVIAGCCRAVGSLGILWSGLKLDGVCNRRKIRWEGLLEIFNYLLISGAGGGAEPHRQCQQWLGSQRHILPSLARGWREAPHTSHITHTHHASRIHITHHTCTHAHTGRGKGVPSCEAATRSLFRQARPLMAAPSLHCRHQVTRAAHCRLHCGVTVPAEHASTARGS